MPSCECQMGTIMKEDHSECIAPPPTTPTPRPDPTLPPVQKAVSQAITRSASTIIIVFLVVTLGIFLALRIFDASRVIHMNMEIALLVAHICLLPDLSGDEKACKVIAVAVHFFFTACFMFMLLEAIHVYSIVAWVVRREGMLAKAQNILIGKT